MSVIILSADLFARARPETLQLSITIPSGTTLFGTPPLRKSASYTPAVSKSASYTPAIYRVKVGDS